MRKFTNQKCMKSFEENTEVVAERACEARMVKRATKPRIMMEREH